MPNYFCIRVLNLMKKRREESQDCMPFAFCSTCWTSSRWMCGWHLSYFAANHHPTPRSPPQFLEHVALDSTLLNLLDEFAQHAPTSYLEAIPKNIRDALLEKLIAITSSNVLFNTYSDEARRQATRVSIVVLRRFPGDNGLLVHLFYRVTIDSAKMALLLVAKLNPNSSSRIHKLVDSSKIPPPLHSAGASNEVECARMLLKAGTMVDALDVNKNTVLSASLAVRSPLSGAGDSVCFLQYSCGASYAFVIYSSVHKSSQGYDQSTLDTVSVFNNFGANVGVLSGVLNSAAAVPASPSGRGWSRSAARSSASRGGWRR
ncbi:hypothetical protein RHSIM_Rhsim02G0064800 [Rhododendron simsii]|uniref:Nodulin-like domain-containing protein n=1 Tax=Rhododendron simsii TaxID=118357 RepID=A0A834LVQ0_RHOSS|nr:hypothetical protein RHSIM_Rhsim02G0064800 [Rhododendron simsii]